MEERLRRFVVLVEAGTYARAASVLHTSQPAVTAAIQKLERELKASLLQRGARGLRLTTAGEVAYRYGRALQVEIDNLHRELQQVRAERELLRLGCIDSVAELAVAEGLVDILESDSELSLTVQNSQQLIRQVERGEVDIAIVAAQGAYAARLRTEAIGREPFVLVCSPGQQRAVELQLHSGVLTKFLAYNHGSTTHDMVQAQCAAWGIAIEPRLYSTNPAVLLQLVLQGKGVAALPARLAKTAPVARITLPGGLYRQLAAVQVRDRILPASVQTFLERLKRALPAA